MVNFIMKYVMMIFWAIFPILMFADAFEGLTLISTKEQPISFTQLIDNELNIVNNWTHDTAPYSIGYLSSDSILYIPSGTKLSVYYSSFQILRFIRYGLRKKHCKT